MIEFTRSEKITLGAEVEIQVLDPSTMDLTPEAEKILNSPGAPEARLKPEIFQSMLEIDTPICADALEVGRSLRASMNTARKIAKQHGLALALSGTHPFASYSQRLLSEGSRYHQLIDRNQWIARRLQIFGLHLHMGMRDGNHAIAMNNAFAHYLPMILALSTSSPFWESEDTGLESCRVTFFESIPTGGHPYLLADWDAFEELVDKLVRSQSITSLKDLWWDIRPSPGFGTLEVRIADCPPTIREIEALVALMHGLALYIDADLRAGKKFAHPPEWILRENKWRASRYGVKAKFVINETAETFTVVDWWEGLKPELLRVCAGLGYEAPFEFVGQLIRFGPSSARQRREFANGAGLSGVVRALVIEGEKDQPIW